VATNAGVDAGRLRTVVELRLRQAGLRVDSAQYDRPLLYVEVTVLGTHAVPVFYSYGFHLALVEPAQVARNGERVWAVTWTSRGVGTGGEQRLAKIIEDGISQLVDKFLNDWLKVNPR
jgi:hypothetical protein